MDVNFFFNSQVTKILTEGKNKICGVETEQGLKFRSQHIVLATGHSAEDMLSHLNDIGVYMEGKSYAMGIRIEHPQSAINKIQYREFATHPKLGAANYKLTYHDYDHNMGVYSFCMCPGGYVLSSGTEKDSVVCNGMSNYNRNSPFANAAIVVTVNHEQLFKKEDTFAGLMLRKKLEQNAFQAVLSKGGKKELPAQNMISFLDKKFENNLYKGSSPSGAMPVDLNQILPDWMNQKIKEGLNHFDRSMKGFITK